MKPLISIVIPSNNRTELLDQAILSIISELGWNSNCELCISDNSEGDETANLVNTKYNGSSPIFANSGNLWMVKQFNAGNAVSFGNPFSNNDGIKVIPNTISDSSGHPRILQAGTASFDFNFDEFSIGGTPAPVRPPKLTILPLQGPQGSAGNVNNNNITFNDYGNNYDFVSFPSGSTDGVFSLNLGDLKYFLDGEDWDNSTNPVLRVNYRMRVISGIPIPINPFDILATPNGVSTVLQLQKKTASPLTSFNPLFGTNRNYLYPAPSTATAINQQVILNKNDISDTNTITELPDYLEANISLDVENFIYDKLIVKNIKGLMLYKDLAFSTDNVEANTLTGSISLNGKFYQKEDNSFKLSINSKFEDINIKTLFYCFNNFNQEYLKYENLDGKINSQFICNTELDNKFKFISDKFQLSSKITISEGELIGFQPMEKLSKFVSLEDLKHIKFSTLKNDIEIKDEVIKIPSMEIKSNALSMIISGYHNFNLEYNYKIKMLLGQILAKTFKSNNIDYNNDELITNVQLRMSGDEDNYDIKFEKLKIKEHIKKGIKQEVKTIKDIIKEDIIDKKQEIVNDDEIEIEWDDNF